MPSLIRGCHGERYSCSTRESLFYTRSLTLFIFTRYFGPPKPACKAMGGRVNIEQLRSRSLRNQKHFRSRALLVLMAETILGKAPTYLGGFCVESRCFGLKISLFVGIVWKFKNISDEILFYSLKICSNYYIIGFEKLGSEKFYSLFHSRHFCTRKLFAFPSLRIHR